MEQCFGTNLANAVLASLATSALSRGVQAAGGSWPTDRLPAFWVETQLFEVALWQWVAVAGLALLAAIVAWLLIGVLARPLGALARALGGDGGFVAAATGPARLLAAVLVFSAGESALGLAFPAVGRFALALALFAVAWLLLRLVDVAAGRTLARLLASGRTGAAGLVPLGARIAKVVIGALAVIAVVQNLGVNVTGILAGLGVGGLAIALAAQKTVENLFGGVSLVADQPVRVGDFCRFGDKIGTIEAIGLRSTRVRTLERTLVTVPNAEFSALQIENYAERDRIRLHLMLGLRYETTPDQLRHVLGALKRLLDGDPRVDPDPARVRLIGFGAHSLDVEVFAYVKTSDYNEYLAIREEILLAIMECIAESGSAFAFPSQTIYGAPDPGLDAARARAAEAEVRSGREAEPTR